MNQKPNKTKYLTTSNTRKFAQSPATFFATSLGKLSVVTAGRKRTHRFIQIISKLLRLFAKPPASSKIECKVFRCVLVLVNLLLLRFDFAKLQYRALTLKDTLVVMSCSGTRTQQIDDPKCVRDLFPYLHLQFSYVHVFSFDFSFR